MLPLDIAPLGKTAGYAIYAALGMGFGVVLELAGFGNSTKLAGQFYLRDMTVLKTMFSAILTACLLMFASAALGLLDFSEIFVNQTYLWPGIVGGLVMGVGFVIGGYCPGTSAVSAASLKLDGILFLLGTVVGATLFGETVHWYSHFWHSSYTERLLLSDWLGWSLGATVVGVTLLALVFFYGAEKTEEAYAAPGAKVRWLPSNRRYVAAASTALGVALGIWALGEPTTEEKWERLGARYQPMLDKREAFIHPLEYVKTWHDPLVKLVTLDLRDQAAFDAFHLAEAKRVGTTDLADRSFLYALDQLPINAVVVLVADDETEAVAAWKHLKVEGVTNLYVLERGLRHWKATFAPVADTPHFDYGRVPAKVLQSFPKDAYQRRIRLRTARRAGGMCS